MWVLAGVLLSLSLIFAGSFPVEAFAADQAEAAATEQTASNRPVADKWALIVGISSFADSTMNLKYPAKDARDFRDFLVNEEKFAPDHVRVLTNEQATRGNILDELGDKWLPRVAGRDDLVIIFISSHGSPSDLDVGGVNYIVAYDTDKNRLYSTGIAMQDMCRIIKARVHTDRALLVLDACHSGAAVPDGKGLTRSGNLNVDEVVQGTGQLVISSSEPAQVSWESTGQANSVFTRHLIDGLRSAGPDTTLAQAYNYMRDKVEDEVRRDRGAVQTPVLKGKWSGNELVLAVNPVRPRPGLSETPVIAPASPAVAPAAQVTGSSPNPVVAAVHPAGEKVTQMQLPETLPTGPVNRIAIIDVDGPQSVEAEDSLGFNLRSGGKKAPTAADLSGLSEALRERLFARLSSSLTDRVVSQEELLDAMNGRHSRMLSSVGSVFRKQMSKMLRAKYLLNATIDSVFFKGHTLTGEEYEMVVTARLVSSETGAVVWKVDKKTFSKHPFDGREPVEYFQDVFCDAVASSLAEKIAKAVATFELK